MADARAEALPLVGSGDHDWNILFGAWGLLLQDVHIGETTRLAGWAGMLAVVLWLAWQTLRASRMSDTWRQQGRRRDAPLRVARNAQAYGILVNWCEPTLHIAGLWDSPNPHSCQGALHEQSGNDARARDVVAGAWLRSSAAEFAE